MKSRRVPTDRRSTFRVSTTCPSPRIASSSCCHEILCSTSTTAFLPFHTLASSSKPLHHHCSSCLRHQRSAVLSIDIAEACSSPQQRPDLTPAIGPPFISVVAQILPATAYSSSCPALLSEANEDGERHVMLCRIIMGNSEKVEAGSNQDHPSNEGFDSGIDDPVNPKWYVVWNTNMNTHIIPEYVVSFKSSSHSSGQRKSMGAQKLSNRPLCRLFTEIGMRLPSSKMQALEILYNQYRVGKFSKEVFIRYMRSVAGDQLLTSSINKLRAC